MQLLGWQALTSQQFQQVHTLRTTNHHKIHMLTKANVSTKNNSEEFSNMFLDYIIKCIRQEL